MTFEEFMQLEPGDGVFYEIQTVTITKVTNYVPGDIVDNGFKVLRYMRELELSFINCQTGCVSHCYPKVFTDHPNEAHNRAVLAKMRLWNPFDND